jgi:hypothetical protein
MNRRVFPPKQYAVVRRNTEIGFAEKFHFNCPILDRPNL